MTWIIKTFSPFPNHPTINKSQDFFLSLFLFSLFFYFIFLFYFFFPSLLHSFNLIINWFLLRLSSLERTLCNIIMSTPTHVLPLFHLLPPTRTYRPLFRRLIHFLLLTTALTYDAKLTSQAPVLTSCLLASLSHSLLAPSVPALAWGLFHGVASYWWTEFLHLTFPTALPRVLADLGLAVPANLVVYMALRAWWDGTDANSGFEKRFGYAVLGSWLVWAIPSWMLFAGLDRRFWGLLNSGANIVWSLVLASVHWRCIIFQIYWEKWKLERKKKYNGVKGKPSIINNNNKIKKSLHLGFFF